MHSCCIIFRHGFWIEINIKGKSAIETKDFACLSKLREVFVGPRWKFTHGQLAACLRSDGRIKTSGLNILEAFIAVMLKSKTFVKKTRSGGVMKIVREHYLRDDIWCGSEVCTECKQESTVLQRDACIESNLCSYPHYLVPDTNVVLHQVNCLAETVSHFFIRVLKQEGLLDHQAV